MNTRLSCCTAVLCAFALILLSSCSTDEEPDNYKQSMRSFVEDLSAWAKAQKGDFVIIAQNGQELLTANGQEDGQVNAVYVSAIDGVGREDLFYGYNNDNEATPSSEQSYMLAFLDIAKANGLNVLVTDYCSSAANIEDSYSKNETKGYISFAASSRELDVIPTYPAAPHNNHSDSVSILDSAKNFLYLINPDDAFISKSDFMNALIQTNYDVLIIDAFFNGLALTASDVQALRYQAGRSRMVIAYMSIGEAEDYRYYWDSTWTTSPPSWLAGENPDWPGNYKVRYWESAWQSIIYGNSSSYLQKIIDAGFDGIYLDIIDAFEYFE